MTIMKIPYQFVFLLSATRHLAQHRIQRRGLYNGMCSVLSHETGEELGGNQPVTPHFSSRRAFVSTATACSLAHFTNTRPVEASTETAKWTSSSLEVIHDPQSYEAVAYVPPATEKQHRFPLLIILPGAGVNDQDAKALLDPMGEHAGLAPSLLATSMAPAELADNFLCVTPYVGGGKRSFYEEPRSKLLNFIQWVSTSSSLKDYIDPEETFLFGFSDGATVAVELATTRRFRAVAVAAYGFSGTLPSQALALLRDLPIWVFHSADDVIFPVAYSDNLVASLRSVSSDPSIVRYTRYDKDQEGFTGSVRGHSTGITASRLPELYTWMISTL